MVTDTRTEAAALIERAAELVEQDTALGDVHHHNVTAIGRDLRSTAGRIRRLARRES